jgi:D-tyrosyl-tRNA(Tyr) deacylase
MRVVIQRVRRAEVRSDGAVLGTIGPGALALVGIGRGDSEPLVRQMADKVAGLRIYQDADGRTNLALPDIGGAILVVSQFTLEADLRRGRRPSFTTAEAPEVAEPLIAAFSQQLRGHGLTVEEGRFGARMEVELVNAGPFTVILDSDRDLGPLRP